jgi:hypothetical protein
LRHVCKHFPGKRLRRWRRGKIFVSESVENKNKIFFKRALCGFWRALCAPAPRRARRRRQGRIEWGSSGRKETAAEIGPESTHARGKVSAAAPRQSDAVTPARRDKLRYEVEGVAGHRDERRTSSQRSPREKRRTQRRTGLLDHAETLDMQRDFVARHASRALHVEGRRGGAEKKEQARERPGTRFIHGFAQIYTNWKRKLRSYPGAPG